MIIGAIEWIWTNDPEKHLANPEGMRSAAILALTTLSVGLLACVGAVAAILGRRAGWAVMVGFDLICLGGSGFLAVTVRPAWGMVVPLAAWLVWMALGIYRDRPSRAGEK